MKLHISVTYDDDMKYTKKIDFNNFINPDFDKFRNNLKVNSYLSNDYF